MIQQLDCYRTPPDWHPGAPLPMRTLWFCAGAPLLSSLWLPGSAWRVWLLRAFGAQIGSGCRLKPGLRVKFPWRLQVGHHCWLAEDAWLDNLAPITIGSDAWIAARAVLAPGTVIGPGGVVALGAVVSGTVPAGAIVRGNPAVVVGQR
jgi:putative colanic acid biosynthesis acetyltransferase WcaF